MDERGTLAWQVLPLYLKVLSYLVAFSILSLQYINTGQCLILHDSDEQQSPTVFIAILVRNKEHTLPWFFGQIEHLNYPKDRMYIWIRSDHNVDNSTNMLHEWVSQAKNIYHTVDFEADYEKKGYKGQKGPCDWNKVRFTNMLKLRQDALEKARRIWADFILFIDVDNILENPDTLNILMSKEKTIIAPMLNSSSFYSNFWCGMDEKGFYKRTPEYVEILQWNKRGVLPVPMVHSTLLINLRHAVSRDLLFYPPHDRYKGPWDDIIMFALTTKMLGVQMYIDNSVYFGMTSSPMSEENTLEDESDAFTHIKLESMAESDSEEFKYVESPLLQYSKFISVAPKTLDKLGFDEVYMINLARRPERRKRMLESLYELGIDAKLYNAVDGKQLNDSYLQRLGIEVLPNFLDPYEKRPLKMGEIGCFLSHYFIWEEIVRNKYQKVLLFEDDVKFEPYFRRKVDILMRNIELNQLKWELIYYGRKRLKIDQEPFVPGFDSLVYPHYSYWTLSYMITYEGAKKLLDMKPLSKLIPVDEYLPIMFDKHPEKSWTDHFSPRDLLAMSVEPLFVYPTHYTGEKNYISDTEDSHEIIGPANNKMAAKQDTLQDNNNLQAVNRYGEQGDRITRRKDEL